MRRVSKVALRAYFPLGSTLFLSLLLCLFISGCEFFDSFGLSPLSEAQVEEIQSFEIESALAKVESASILVLQGLGYKIETRNSAGNSTRNSAENSASTSFIEAKGLVRQHRAADECDYVWDSYRKEDVRHCRAGERYNVYRRLTLAFEQIGDYTHLRLIIVIVDSKNGDRIFTNNSAHEEIFSRIEERLFLREALSSA